MESYNTLSFVTGFFHLSMTFFRFIPAEACSRTLLSFSLLKKLHCVDIKIIWGWGRAERVVGRIQQNRASQFLLGILIKYRF